jgi:hypothetical protein
LLDLEDLKLLQPSGLLEHLLFDLGDVFNDNVLGLEQARVDYRLDELVLPMKGSLIEGEEGSTPSGETDEEREGN